MKKTKIWIAGPCSIENERVFIGSAERLSKIFFGKNWYLKGSFDKANRSSVNGERGPGLERSLEIFKEVKNRFPEIKIITDIHETWHIEKLVDYVDAVQIPAFLCRQTDLLQESGRLFNAVNVKKGQWINPKHTKYFSEKIKKYNPGAEVWITERGTVFGYSNLIVDFSAAEVMRRYCDHLILDCTHSSQSYENDFTSGNREFAKKLLYASLHFDYDGIFMEAHIDPQRAISDGASQIEIDQLAPLLEKFDALDEYLGNL